MNDCVSDALNPNIGALASSRLAASRFIIAVQVSGPVASELHGRKSMS
jgi:hypothetical protein